MLRLIPPAAHRTLYRLAHRARLVWWRLRRPTIRGVRVIACDANDRVLLIRHSYGSGKWMLPGGGLGRRESPLAAAARELAEETGCNLLDAYDVTVGIEPLGGATNRVHIVAGSTADIPRPDGREVIEAGFFSLDALPGDAVAGLAPDLARWLTSEALRPDPEPAR